MQIKLTNITGIASLNVEHFDLHEEFGAAYLVDAGERVTLCLNQTECRSWLKQEHPHIGNIKWFDQNTVILYYDEGVVAIVSGESWNNSRLGAFELGIRDLMDKDRDSWQFEEVEAGYIFDNKFAFIAYSSELFWVLDVSKRSWTKFPVSFATVGIKVLTGNDKTAYAIFDHRSLLSAYPDRPPFELAVFDLLSETSSKQDFALIETELMTSGFEMSEISQIRQAGSSSATAKRPRSSSFPAWHKPPRRLAPRRGRVPLSRHCWTSGRRWTISIVLRSVFRP